MKADLIQKLLNCEITWKEANAVAPTDSYVINSENDIYSVDANTLKRAIEQCLDGKYSFCDLLDWANVVRFSDVFMFDEHQKDCIISILDRIEESDEPNKALTKDDLLLMLKKINNNMEW